MSVLNSITVFCASSTGHDPRFIEQATALGEHLAKHNVCLVYGGGQVGLMGTIANAALRQKGEVVGIIPTFLDTKEIAHKGLTKLHVVENMHQRKKLMHDLADGFIALPGGFGTLEELFEIITWAQLGLHGKPIGLLNINGFYDHLIALLKHIKEQGLLRQQHFDMLLVAEGIEELWAKMRAYEAPSVTKWLDSKSKV